MPSEPSATAVNPTHAVPTHGPVSNLPQLVQAIEQQHRQPIVNLPQALVSLRILDGDMVVVERNRPTKTGDIVVALVDNELTVKYLHPLKGSGGWVLKPANPDYPDIVAQQSLEVLGVVVGLFRRF